MKRYFPLENHYYKLLVEISNTIKEYYPIAVNVNSSEYNEYPGIKKLDAMIAENIRNNKILYEPWTLFLNLLKKRSKKKVHNTSLPHEISFSGELILETYQDESLKRIKKLKFAVSMLGSYFSICGVDETLIKEKDDQRAYPAINVVTVSPYKEFEPMFNFLETNIRAQFVDYKLIPFDTSLLHFKNIQTPYSNLEEGTVYNALFNNAFDNFHTGFLRGDTSYGFDKEKIGELKNITITLIPPPPIK